MSNIIVSFIINDMTRSRKKTPIVSWASCGKGKAMKQAKKLANHRVRQKIKSGEDIPNGRIYRRLEERYTWPDDGKQYWDDPRAYRK